MEELSKRYNPAEIEDKWYAHWMEAGHFRSVPDSRASFSIVIPPPNVTGQLHMGHILNNTIQDVLIRRARQEGKNACWVPGTDHASIATEAKVVQMLREKGIRKSDLSREEFLKYAWEWTDKYGGIILHQLKKLGASCDWDRTAFTLDETRSDAVIDVFIDLYKKGKIYRGKRMVNWDPAAQTVLSNEEVIYEEEKTTLYKVRYKITGPTDEWITIATTRPETILGDTAIAVHPDDERYRHLHGKTVAVPLIRREIPVIADTYVDRAFGTGALKVTPAHDINDYEIGLRHHLEVIDVLNPDGSMSVEAQLFIGLDRDDARNAMADALQEAGHMVATEELIHNVGRSERTRVVVEPRLSLQWFVDMKSLAGPALSAVMEGEIGFYPDNLRNTYRHWMENIRDWCISRQLWWGHRIPAWYFEHKDEELVFIAKSAEEALAEAQKTTGRDELQLSDLRQDEDVLDTWFSSWLWPISVFDGWKSDKDFSYYYPTNVLVTGWDIIFLWVARMIMAGYEWKGQKPFHAVYFTGMVRDKQRRKMSKQLGNSPDALGLIDQYGADGVRYGIMASAPAGGDILFDEKLCELGRNFCNKLWNALRLVKSWQVDAALQQDDGRALAVRWMASRYNATDADLRQQYSQFRLSEAVTSLYTFVWDDFCSIFLEVIKPSFGESLDKRSYDATQQMFEDICKLLHPFMPFITEEIWHRLRAEGHKDGRPEEGDCMQAGVSASPGNTEPEIEEIVGHVLTVKSAVLELRNQYQLSPKEEMKLLFPADPSIVQLWGAAGAKEVLYKLANAIPSEGGGDGISFLAGRYQYHAVLQVKVDKEAELARMKEELAYYQGFVSSVDKKLSNEKFVAHAKPEVVEKERLKKADGEAKIEQLLKSIAQLN